MMLREDRGEQPEQADRPRRRRRRRVLEELAIEAEPLAKVKAERPARSTSREPDRPEGRASTPKQYLEAACNSSCMCGDLY